MSTSSTTVSPGIRALLSHALPLTTCVGLAVVFVLGLGLSRAFAGPVLEFRHTDGTVVKGELMRVGSDHFVVKIGNNEEQLPFAKLTPKSVYDGRSAVAGTFDTGERLALGKYCLEHELFEEAIREFTLAREAANKVLDQAGDLLMRAREAAGRSLVLKADQLRDGGKLQDALILLLTAYKDYPMSDVKFRDDVAARIVTLQRTLGVPKPDELPAPAPLNPVNANPNAGNPGGNPNQPAVNPFDDPKQMPRQVVFEYERLKRLLDDTSKMLNDGKEFMDQALGMGQPLTSSQPQQLFRQADEKFGQAGRNLADIRKRLAEPKLAEAMPKLSRHADVIKNRCDTLTLELALHQMHAWGQAQNNDNTARWIGRVLSLDSRNEEAIRTRMKLTEKQLQQK